MKRIFSPSNAVTDQAMRKAHSNRPVQPKKNTGFTLIEVLVVIAIIGFLIMIVAPRVFGTSDSAKAMNYFTAADRLTTNWRTANESCGTSKIIGTSPITTTVTTAAHLQFLVDGTGLNPQYQACYNSSNIQPARTQIQGDASNGYTVGESVISIQSVTINGQPRVQTSFTNVADQLVLQLFQKYSSVAGARTATALPASDASDPQIQFSAATNGSRTLTIIR
ncbi:type II secretion system protein [Chromobacterium piscinae]|uniref:type II secretion system protein n=1 Tax=Chromobacterium piscinae TaxID=686831 RepID=UPI001E5528A9|nr:prepilin-type N-terminal cleavage/methylation domain-containing protein [Chromobacterium piscinae]MCD5327916.1 prepilin-type N-terminal cleavage/methylation domain-containing protein [Chromobacterium piscinae]